MKLTMIFLAMFVSVDMSAEEALRIYPGFVTKLTCEGKLLVSAIGNAQIVRLEALPKEIGCGAILKPLVQKGITNLVIETSTGSTSVVVKIEPGIPRTQSLTIAIKPSDNLGVMNR